MAEPRWLDEDEQAMWRAFLGMQRALAQATERQLAGLELSSADYAMLAPLSETPDGVLRVRDLGRAAGWDRSRLAHQLRRMERRGLVRRFECPTDARGTMVELTAAGRSAVRAAAPGHVETVRRFFVDLVRPAEREVLTAVATRVLAATAEAGGDLDADCGGREPADGAP
ncbi:MarR family winged helix-turn-helix transcriptional regulator [Plantactinospora siamensis]|uniref:MarR family winged helix-turn-helix transcriptional regulator n=1 Tax=Plantactinospora siamensis TaxID=555372 RepID=A0ABV6P1F3_9ACTN